MLLRYKTCTDAASVIAMQEVMILEMEAEQNERSAFLNFFTFPFVKEETHDD